jgi:hypothetical protein
MLFTVLKEKIKVISAVLCDGRPVVLELASSVEYIHRCWFIFNIFMCFNCQAKYHTS